MNGLTTGTVAKRAGVNVETMRYYERRGLLPSPPRTVSNYRLYTDETVRRVRFIKRAQELGFTLNEIKELLALRDGRGRKRSEVRAFAEAKMRDIDQKLAQLQAMRGALQTLVESCACGDGRPTCPIIEALDDPQDRASSVRPTAPRRNHVRR